MDKLELLQQAYQKNEESHITWIVYQAWESVKKDIKNWDNCNEAFDKTFFYTQEFENAWQKTAYGYFMYMSENHSDHPKYIHMIRILQEKV